VLARDASSRRPHTATVRALRNPAVGATVVVDAVGRTLYRLSPEGPRHLLCTRSCLQSWQPLTVASRASGLVTGLGVDGRLATFRRPDGTLQVILRGFPLYRFSADRSAGQSFGRALHGFGGVWEVILARSSTRPPHRQGPPSGPKLPPNPPPI